MFVKLVLRRSKRCLELAKSGLFWQKKKKTNLLSPKGCILAHPHRPSLSLSLSLSRYRSEATHLALPDRGRVWSVRGNVSYLFGPQGMQRWALQHRKKKKKTGKKPNGMLFRNSNAPSGHIWVARAGICRSRSNISGQHIDRQPKPIPVTTRRVSAKMGKC